MDEFDEWLIAKKQHRQQPKRREKQTELEKTKDMKMTEHIMSDREDSEERDELINEEEELARLNDIIDLKLQELEFLKTQKGPSNYRRSLKSEIQQMLLQA